MNLAKLQQAEHLFLQRYPGGFEHPEMLAIGKKHKMDKMIKQSQEYFASTAFKNPRSITENMTKMVSRSSMVSMFEKPKFRDYVNALKLDQTNQLSQGLEALLYGDQQEGFQSISELLVNAKLAKWSLITILPNYVFPLDEVFVKPTTAKGVISYFELPGLDYKPKPSWNFYQEYREAVLEMRSHVDESLRPNNAAFCGFLMMSLYA